MIPLRDRLGAWVARSPEQRVGFDLVWTMAARDRQFKLRVYPTMALIFIWPIIMLLVADETAAQTIAGLSAGKKHLFLLYLGAFMFPTMLVQLQFSHQFEAAWIYRALPVRRPGELMVGALKALAWRFVLPVYVLFTVGLLVLVGPSALPDIALALCLTGVVTVGLALVMNPGLPFSTNLSALQSGGKFGKNMFLMILPAAAWLGHYLLTKLPYAVAAAIVPAALLYLLFERIYAGFGWSNFEARSEAQ